MLYVDTSVIVKLYIKEQFSQEVSNWIRANNEAIPLTLIHDLEFNNAMCLKQFRLEITQDEARAIELKKEDHERKGIYYRPAINWTDTFQCAIDLSKKYTRKIGSRSLDIIHVASAISMKANRFLSFDERQRELAHLEGLGMEGPGLEL